MSNFVIRYKDYLSVEAELDTTDNALAATPETPSTVQEQSSKGIVTVRNADSYDFSKIDSQSEMPIEISVNFNSVSTAKWQDFLYSHHISTSQWKTPSKPFTLPSGLTCEQEKDYLMKQEPIMDACFSGSVYLPEDQAEQCAREGGVDPIKNSARNTLFKNFCE